VPRWQPISQRPDNLRNGAPSTPRIALKRQIRERGKGSPLTPKIIIEGKQNKEAVAIINKQSQNALDQLSIK
jgi:hypothetical protein